MPATGKLSSYLGCSSHQSRPVDRGLVGLLDQRGYFADVVVRLEDSRKLVVRALVHHDGEREVTTLVRVHHSTECLGDEAEAIVEGIAAEKGAGFREDLAGRFASGRAAMIA